MLAANQLRSCLQPQGHPRISIFSLTAYLLAKMLKNHPSLNGLTVVLISNRAKEASVALKYYKSLKLSVLVPAPSVIFYNAISQLYENDNSITILAPNADGGMLARTLSLKNQLKTPFFVFASDDDMLLPQGLKKALVILENNPSLVNYYGLTAKALFKFPFFPIINPCYDYCINSNDDRLECLKVFARYRFYPLIYGVSRSSVLEAYIKLYPANTSVWMGIYELIYSIAVSLHGGAYYDNTTEFLLRLEHQASRTSLQEYPEVPKLEHTPASYLCNYVNINAINSLMLANGIGRHFDFYLNAIYQDVISDSHLRYTRLTVSIQRFPLLSCLKRSVFLNLISLVRNPSYLAHYVNFFVAALRYYWHRTRYGVKVTI